MKRKQTKIKPSWQTIPMADVITLIEGWQRLKMLQNEIKDRPAALADLQFSNTQQTYFVACLADMFEWILPSAQSYMSAWLSNSQTPRPDLGNVSWEIKATRDILFLWECWCVLLRRDQGEEKTRWLSHISREESLLITRLDRRIPISQP